MRYLKYFLDGDEIDFGGQDPYAEGESSLQPVYWNDNTGQYYDESGNAKFDTNLDAAGTVGLKNMKFKNGKKAKKQGEYDALHGYGKRNVTGWTGYDKGRKRYTRSYGNSINGGYGNDLMQERDMNAEMRDAYESAYDTMKADLDEKEKKKNERLERIETMKKKGGEEGVRAMQDEVRSGQDDFLDTVDEMRRSVAGPVGYGLAVGSAIPVIGDFVAPVATGFNGINAGISVLSDIGNNRYDRIVGDVAPFVLGQLTRGAGKALSSNIMRGLGNVGQKSVGNTFGNTIGRLSTNTDVEDFLAKGLNFGKNRLIKRTLK